MTQPRDTSPSLPDADEGGHLSKIVPNFRAVTAADGQPAAYRCSELHKLSAHHKSQLVQLGITDVIDLRTSDESKAQPDALPASITLHSADALADSPSAGATQLASFTGPATSVPSFTPGHIAAIMQAFGHGKSQLMMLQTYTDLVTLPSAHVAYQTLLTVMLEPDRKCAFHCTAGKDRTGWGAALLDTLAGRTHEQVRENYLASNAAWERVYEPVLASFSAAGGDPTALGDLLWVSPDYLEQAHHSVVTRFGSVEDYVIRALAMTTEQVDALKSQLE